jgi:hypothetical protein
MEPPARIGGTTQSPIQGHSFAHVFADAAAPSKHHTQYFEMFGHRAIYHDGWRAVCPWPGPSFVESGASFGAPLSADELVELDAKRWELYHVEKDVAETNDLSQQERPRLIEMIGTWYVEAGKYGVLPIDSRGPARFADERPQIAPARSSYTFYPKTQAVPANAGPALQNRPHAITADVEVPPTGAEGCLFSSGDRQGGFSFFVQAGRLHYVYNYVGSQLFHVQSNVTLPMGRHRLRMEFELTGKPDIPNGKGAPGRAQLYIDEKLVGQADVPLTMPLTNGLAAGFVCGADPGSPVWKDYAPPFEFTGTLHQVTVDVSGEHIRDSEAEVRIAMARQ